jgi:hypothetical protein
MDEDVSSSSPTVEMTTDLANMPNSSGGGPETQPESEDPDHRMNEVVLPPKAGLEGFLAGNARRRKLALNDDLDHTRQARRDEIQVQEQALDMLRNVMCGTGASEMIDFVFREMGQNDLLDTLADKLRPRSLSGFGRRDSVSSSKTIPAPTEIVCSVTYIMIHIAAGLTRHRQLLILHRDILKLMMPLFNHSNKQIRVNCVWVVINLTFQDNESDRGCCQERAMKLKTLGAMERLSSLEEDTESDVRERTKTALHQMTTLLR